MNDVAKKILDEYFGCSDNGVINNVPKDELFEHIPAKTQCHIHKVDDGEIWFTVDIKSTELEVMVIVRSHYASNGVELGAVLSCCSFKRCYIERFAK